VGSYDKGEEKIYAKKREDIPIVKKKKEEIREFIREQLRKGYIWPSKSPQMASVFFVEKKDRKK